MPRQTGPPQVVTIANVLAAASGPGPVWTHTCLDLNVNLLSFDAGQGVPEHVNDEVDVLIVVVAGEGILKIDGTTNPLRAGQICVVPRGARRSIHSGGGPFADLTCHRRRGGLWPDAAGSPGRPGA